LGQHQFGRVGIRRNPGTIAKVIRRIASADLRFDRLDVPGPTLASSSPANDCRMLHLVKWSAADESSFLGFTKHPLPDLTAEVVLPDLEKFRPSVETPGVQSDRRVHVFLNN
jgi:hypothetical protein